MIIDYNKGVKSDTILTEDGTSVTTFRISEVKPLNYCRLHHGLVVKDGEVYEWHEDCDHD